MPIMPKIDHAQFEALPMWAKVVIIGCYAVYIGCLLGGAVVLWRRSWCR